MTRTHRLLHSALPYALMAALAPMALAGNSTPAEACDGCATHAQAQAPIESTQLLVVKFHADWCGSCVKLDSPLQDLQATFSDQPIDFVRLDLTDDTSRAVAKEKVGRLGLDEIFASYGSKTGFALLIDAESGEVLGELRASQELEAMRGQVESSLSRSKS